jgi:serine/threonine protein kinase
LTNDERRRVVDLADRLEEEWRRAASVRLESLLPSIDDPLRPAALQELVKTDLEIRWRRGLPLAIERYLEQFPELAARSAAVAELLYEEYRVRTLHGDRPPLDDYRDRFPRQFDDLRRLVDARPLPAPAAPLPAPAAPPAPPSTPLMESNVVLPIGGGYTLEKLIGRGGFGEVWRARAPGGFLVAVKIIARAADHEERIREERALEVVKQLHHHFLIKTHAVYAEQEKLFIVMELADASVRDRLKECRATGQAGIPLAELIGYTRESAESLDYLHGKGALHRDVKPDNVLLVEGHVRLADFGLVRRQDQHLVSVSGSGTPAYMAPEVWRGKAGPASDQYSLAYAYAELRLGRRPFTSTDFAAVMFDHLEHAPDLGNLPAAEKDVVRQALAKNPDERFPTCTDFARALRRLLDDVSDPPTYLGSGTGKPRPLLAPDKDDDGPTGRTAATPGGAAAVADEAPRTEHGDVDTDEPPTEFTQIPPVPITRRDRTLAPSPGADDSLIHTTVRTPTAPPPVRTPKAPPARRRPWKGFFVFLGVAAAGLVAVAAAVFFIRPGPPTTGPSPTNPLIAKFALTAPPAVSLYQGRKTTVPIRVKRTNCDDEIRLSFSPPEGVTAAEAVIPAGADEASVTLEATSGAPVKESAVGVHGTAPGMRNDVEMRLTVLRAIFLPRDFQPGDDGKTFEDKQLGRELYRKIVFVKEGVPPTEFLLIPHEDADDPPSFYLMKTKASNALVAALIPALGGALWPRNGDRPSLPAFGLKAADARAAAAALGGLLPTTAQWDKAAGYYRKEGRTGPAAGPLVAVGLIDQEPWPVDKKDSDDVSPYGVRDMGGNGTEFTRDVMEFPRNVRKLHLAPPYGPEASDLVVLRGKRHTAPAPLSYAELKDQQVMDQKATPQVQLEPTASPYTGFRVAIELPAP